MQVKLEKDSFSDRVEQLLVADLSEPAEGLSRPAAMLASAARRLCLAQGAKRARPRLVARFGLALNVDVDRLVPLGAAAELVHSASLLHDDVIDEADTRRGVEAANIRWGNVVAILTGDWVLSRALSHLEGYPPPVRDDVVRVLEAMTQSAMAEIEARGHLDRGVETWEAVARGKTAALFGWCGRAPAHLAGDGDALERFGRVGVHLGLAFQLTDDLLDLVGRDSGGDSGKNRFADIRNREPSYPLLIASDASPGFRSELQAAWATDRIESEEVWRLGEAVMSTDGPPRTLARIRAEVDAAIEALGPWASRPGGSDIATWATWLAERVSLDQPLAAIA